MKKMASVVGLVTLLVLATPERALAHAGFVSSQPEPGSQLGSAPGVVVLEFSEPLNLELSRASVVAPDGQSFVGRASGSQELRVALSTNLQGVYLVEWTTVSTVDGHTLHGSFRFGVGVSPGEDAEGTVNDEPTSLDLLVAAGRIVEDVALLLAVGILLIGALARREPHLTWVRLRLGPTLVVAFAAGTLVVIGEALLAAPSPSVGAVVTYLTSGLTGVARLSRPLLEAAAAALVFVAPRLVVVPLAAVLMGLSAAGHAAVVRPVWWGIGVEAVHLATAGLWAGGILSLAFLRPPGGWLGEEGRLLLERFSPIALCAFAITVTTGAVRGVQEVGSIHDLIASAYGLVLLTKVLVVMAMVQFSILAWRRILAVPRVEAGLAVLAVTAAALLAAFPLPPARTAAEEGVERSIPSAALPSTGDLTLGAHAGQVLVGLTLRPGTPGSNEVFLYLLPLEGEPAASALQVAVRLDGRPLDVRQCGDACRSTDAQLDGGDHVAVRVRGPTGGTATFRLPALPAPAGATLVHQMMSRMGQLKTYRLDEKLSSGLVVVHTIYAFQRPDEMKTRLMEAGGGSEAVWAGPVRYTRTLPGGPWMVEKGGPPLQVPSFIWDSFHPLIDARILGSVDVNGTRTREVVFFGATASTPVWFRVWVDDSGLAREAVMTAQGHFMDQRYYGFNAPVSIRRPQQARTEAQG